MEIVFVQHGEAMHQLGGGSRLHAQDPPLTDKGKREAVRLSRLEPLSESDAIVAGPVLYLLQTADLWSKGTGCSRFVHPLAGPRQHPFRYDFRTPPCEWPMESERITTGFPEFLPPAHLPEHLWLQGIHTLPGILFAQHAERFLAWCRNLEKSRVFIVTAEGTLQAYRAHLAAGSSGGRQSAGRGKRLSRWSVPLPV
ncbi:histidine phosphatase family protein [Paenibacillus allorhizosphaerae]|uniref:Histidine phosphatase family protein n=1 Tax=Paenibacillus allorhizosphaerae TaxID=2849866 RepID=A0ABM8VHK6_9BACL|nr:histidine phosphatase family protein [Paenibacillus allorhizosphaerae]CAG7642340.1 hypothetical protein PAECIP111802_02846 [Paenibacillus allorhizosphaerae]